MKKRLFLIGVAALATTLATVGCGGDEGSMDIGDDGEIVFRNVNISFQHVITGTDNTYLTNLVNEFNKEHQGQIRVQAAPVQAADIYGNLPLTTSNNRNSDVMLIHAERVLQFAAQEVLWNLLKLSLIQMISLQMFGIICNLMANNMVFHSICIWLVFM